MLSTVLDWILVAIFVLVAIVGFSRGFLKSLLGLFGNVLALLLSYILAPAVTTWINGRFLLADKLAAYVVEILPMPPDFSTLLASFSGLGELYAYLDQSFLPASLRQSILSAVQEQINAVGAGVYATMADVIATTVATSLLRGVVFIGLWLLLSVLLFLLAHAASGVIHLVPVVGLADRVGGMLASLALAGVTLLILYKGISILGLMDGTFLSQSQILHFCSQLLNPAAGTPVPPP